VAISKDGGFVGYAAVLPYGDDYRYDFYVDPIFTDASLGAILLQKCEIRGLDLYKNQPDKADTYARVFISHMNERDKSVVVDAGFSPGKYYTQMRVDLEKPLPSIKLPKGFSYRTFLPGGDDRQVYELVQAAFYQPDRRAQTYEDWKTFMMNPDLFEPELWFLAVKKGRIVGVCLCVEYSDLGWIRQLGVQEDLRRKGVGTVLLNIAYNEFKRRGFSKAGLSVVSERPSAYTFYKKAGMYPVRQYDEYKKPLAISDVK
jgi:GNAT superfamily N-acetyltransferase